MSKRTLYCAASGEQGYTLLELTIAIAVAAIITGATMYAGYSFQVTAKQQRSMKEMTAVAETSELAQLTAARKANYVDIAGYYPNGRFVNYSGTSVPANAFGGKILLSNSDDKLISVITQMPAGTAATVGLGMSQSGTGSLPITGISQRVVSHGIADEAFWSKRQVFRNFSSFY